MVTVAVILALAALIIAILSSFKTRSPLDRGCVARHSGVAGALAAEVIPGLD